MRRVEPKKIYIFIERQPTEIIGLRSLSYLGVFLDNVLCKYPVKFVKKKQSINYDQGFIYLIFDSVLEGNYVLRQKYDLLSRVA